MQPVRKPTWQQATALVSLSTCGAMTGFAFAHGTVGEMTSPTRMPVHLLALEKPAKPAPVQSARTARCGRPSSRWPITTSGWPSPRARPKWKRLSGERTASTAWITVNPAPPSPASRSRSAHRPAGQESWVTGGTTYPWPLHQWADVRVDPNPASPADHLGLAGRAGASPLAPARRRLPATAGRLGDVRRPRRGGHQVLGRSPLHDRRGLEPNLSVNAHTFTGPLAAQGVTGFVNNGELLSAVSRLRGPSGGRYGAGHGGPAHGRDGRGRRAETAGIPAAPSGGRRGGSRDGDGGADVERQPRRRWRTARPWRAARRRKKGTARMVGTAGGSGHQSARPSMVAMPGMMAGRGHGRGQWRGGRHRPPGAGGEMARAGTARATRADRIRARAASGRGRAPRPRAGSGGAGRQHGAGR